MGRGSQEEVPVRRFHRLFELGIIASLTLLAATAPAAELLNDPAPARRAFGGIQPQLSPDGQWIALSYQGAICRLPRAGGTLARLTREEGWDLDPAWSGDGQRIAFVSSHNFFLGQLRVIQAADGSSVRLPADVRARGRVAFHPDGNRVLGRFSLSGQTERLSWFDLITGALAPLELEGVDQQPRQWALSERGDWILFTTTQDRPGEQEGNNGPQTDVWKIPAQGGRSERLFRWPARIYNLCWDAQDQGAFVTTDRGTPHNDVWHVPLENSLAAARSLTRGQADEDWPSTSRDGRWLVHTENHEGATALVLIDLTTGESRTVALNQLDFLEPTAQLRLTVHDKKTNEPTVARICVKQRQGKFHAPLGALYRLTAGQGYFYCRRETALALPAGAYEIVAARGPEYRPQKIDIVLDPDQTNAVALPLERWTDMAAQGWYSGENHVHANYGYGAWHNRPDTVLDLCEGEDLNVANVMVANSDGDGVFDRQFFLGRPDHRSRPKTILFWNEEFRSTLWGHMTLINLERLVEPIFTGFKDTTNPWDVPTNADIAEQTRRQNGSVSYTHPANNAESPYDGAYSAKGLPIDAALGRIDTLDVMGFGYEASMRLWYRLLNCGFRIPLAAGTDCFLNRIPSYPPGWGRAYVKLPRGLEYKDWIENQRAGRSFVTTGPMLALAVDEFEIGDTLRLTAPRSVRVKGRAWSSWELDNLELIVNGQVVAQGRLSTDKLEADLDHSLPVDRSGWIALRTSSSQRTIVGLRPVAQTSPIYFEYPGHPPAAKADAEFFLAWIDRLERDLQKRDRVPFGLDHVQMQLDAARNRYRQIASGSGPVSGPKTVP